MTNVSVIRPLNKVRHAIVLNVLTFKVNHAPLASQHHWLLEIFIVYTRTAVGIWSQDRRYARDGNDFVVENRITHLCVVWMRLQLYYCRHEPFNARIRNGCSRNASSRPIFGLLSWLATSSNLICQFTVIFNCWIYQQPLCLIVKRENNPNPR